MNCLSQGCNATGARALTISLKCPADTNWDIVGYGDDSFLIGTTCDVCGERTLKKDHINVITEYLSAMVDGVEG